MIDGMPLVDVHLHAARLPTLKMSTDEWLQVGFSGFPSLAGSDLYYELTLPSGQPTYHQIAADLPPGKTTRFAVLEMRNRYHAFKVETARQLSEFIALLLVKRVRKAKPEQF